MAQVRLPNERPRTTVARVRDASAKDVQAAAKRADDERRETQQRELDRAAREEED